MKTEEYNIWNNISKLKKLKIITILIYCISSFFLLKNLIEGRVSPIIYFIDNRENRIMMSTAVMLIFLIILLNIIIRLFNFKIEENRYKIILMYREWEEELDKLLKKDLSINVLLNLYPGHTREQQFRIEKIIKEDKDGNSFMVFKKLFANSEYRSNLFKTIDPTNIAKDLIDIEETIKMTKTKSFLDRSSYKKEIEMIREFVRKSIRIMQSMELIKLYLFVDLGVVFSEEEYKKINKEIIGRVNESKLSIYKILKEMRPYHHGFFNKPYCRASFLVSEKFKKDLFEINSEEGFNKILIELFDNEGFKESVLKRKEEFLSN